MSLRQRINRFKKNSENNTGFGTNSANSGDRFFNRRTGSANVLKKGVGILERYSWYHTMLSMPTSKFLLLLFLIYVCINLGFAFTYYLIGIDHLGGVNKGSALKNFTELFFFSTQTFTTVGYGRISPVGFLASLVATFEAFLGLLSFAIATGLFYGRFSRPRAFLKFSDHAIIAPFKNGMALMFRMAPYKNNSLSEAEVKLTLAMQEKEQEKTENRFYTLDLEISNINALVLNWTVVHPIDEKSPLYNYTFEEIVASKCEVFVYVRAFDEVFSTMVISRTSYIAEDIIWGAKFKIMYHPSDDNKTTVLRLDQLNDYEKAELPVLSTEKLTV